MSKSAAAIAFLLPFTLPPQTQKPKQEGTAEECRGAIYDVKTVTRRASIIAKPDINITKQALAHDLHGRIVLEVVLCRTGRVTDVKVIQGLPYGMTESALAAVHEVKFKPAELHWHTVSQRTRFEYSINERGTQGIMSGNASPRLVEAVDIIGNRSLTRNEILEWVRTRPGEPYSQEQITRDIVTIVSTGYFDGARSRVTTEDGVRGGVVVIFEVVELALIREVKFEGIAGIEQSVILDALLQRRVDLHKGAVFNSEQMGLAIRVIKELLASRGMPNAKVELKIQNVTATTVALTFAINADTQE